MYYSTNDPDSSLIGKTYFSANGFVVLDHVFTEEEIGVMLNNIAQADSNKQTFYKTDYLFAIRQFLKEVPEVRDVVFTSKLKAIVSSFFGNDYFVVKSIYFDKSEGSNWFVSYHQDLTIAVKEKLNIEGFGPWTVKQNQYAVQPPVSILENNFTIRIHLDDTNENNGALKVIPGSHLKGIYRPKTIDWAKEHEVGACISSRCVVAG